MFCYPDTLQQENIQKLFSKLNNSSIRCYQRGFWMKWANVNKQNKFQILKGYWTTSDSSPNSIKRVFIQLEVYAYM